MNTRHRDFRDEKKTKGEMNFWPSYEKGASENRPKVVFRFLIGTASGKIRKREQSQRGNEEEALD